MSNDIDWNKAPDWAQEFATNPASERAWLGESGYSYLIGNGGIVSWENSHAFSRGEFNIIESRPAAWNGQGLPPVGIACEVENNVSGGWDTVDEVLAHTVINDDQVAVFRRQDSVYYSPAKAFRPARTPEQIRADERNAQILGLADELAGYQGREAGDKHKKIAEYLHDNGYRKQVTQ
jgi:hypothetical protein